MKILATFIILLTLCSLTLTKKSMKSEKSTKTELKKSTSASKTEATKSDPGAILPAAAV